MKKPNFLTGLLFGVLIGLLIWYWQKSTSAEDGALDLLDRMAERDVLARRQASQAVPAEPPDLKSTPTVAGDTLPSFLANRQIELDTAESPVDLTVIHGVGPVFAGRLQAAGIDTIAAVGETAVLRLAEVLQISESRAQTIQAAARAI